MRQPVGLYHPEQLCLYCFLAYDLREEHFISMYLYSGGKNKHFGNNLAVFLKLEVSSREEQTQRCYGDDFGGR